MAAAASSTPVASGFVRISREPIDDLKEVLRQSLFGQGRVVAPEHPANLLEERGVCHRICRYGAAVRAALMPASAPITSLRLIRSPRRRAGEEMLADQCRVPWRLS